jgi:hypothetical protein
MANVFNGFTRQPDDEQETKAQRRARIKKSGIDKSIMNRSFLHLDEPNPEDVAEKNSMVQEMRDKMRSSRKRRTNGIPTP